MQWKRMDTSGKGKAGCDEATQRNRVDRNRADGQCKGTAERRGDRKSNAKEWNRRDRKSGGKARQRGTKKSEGTAMKDADLMRKGIATH